MALREGVVVAYGPRPDRAVRMVALDENAGDRFPLERPGKCGRHFADFVRGAATVLSAEGRRLPGVDLVIASSLPARRGLASSAAYIVAVLRAFLAVSGSEPPTPKQLAAWVEEIEHTFAGVPCGAMDPIACAVGAVGQPIALDCATLAYEVLPWPADLDAIAHDTGIERELSATPYAARRLELERGLASIHALRPEIRSLADVGPAAFSEFESTLREPERMRVRHVVFEIERVRRAIDAIRGADGATLGRLMNEGHQSLSDDFAASTPEIDALACDLRRQPDVLGVRLQGAGWGGSLAVLRRKAPGADGPKDGARGGNRTLNPLTGTGS